MQIVLQGLDEQVGQMDVGYDLPQQRRRYVAAFTDRSYLHNLTATTTRVVVLQSVCRFRQKLWFMWASSMQISSNYNASIFVVRCRFLRESYTKLDKKDIIIIRQYSRDFSEWEDRWYLYSLW